MHLKFIHCYVFFIHLKLKILFCSYWSLLQICIFRSFQMQFHWKLQIKYYCLHGMGILVFEPQLILIIFALFEIPHAGHRYIIGTYAVLVYQISIV